MFNGVRGDESRSLLGGDLSCRGEEGNGLLERL